MALQADNARKALSELPFRSPKRLTSFLMLVAFGERALVRETTKWLHAINGDPVKGRAKKEFRKELGLVQEEDKETAKTGLSPASADENKVTIDNPLRHGMPLTYLDGLSGIEFVATSQTVKGKVTVTRWEIQGTHTGTLLGVPPTRKSVTVAGITWIEFEQRETAEGNRESWATGEWTYWDLLSLMEQLGVAP